MEGNMVLRMKKVRPGAQLPQRQTAGSAGFDLCACIQEPVVLEPGDMLYTGDGCCHSIRGDGDTPLEMVALILFS